MKINSIIKERRLHLGMTQEQLAQTLGITAPAVNKWEKGSCCPDISLLPELARVLKTDMNTLFGFETQRDAEIISAMLPLMNSEERKKTVSEKSKAYIERGDYQSAISILRGGFVSASQEMCEMLREIAECYRLSSKYDVAEEFLKKHSELIEITEQERRNALLALHRHFRKNEDVEGALKTLEDLIDETEKPSEINRCVTESSNGKTKILMNLLRKKSVAMEIKSNMDEYLFLENNQKFIALRTRAQRLCKR